MSPGDAIDLAPGAERNAIYLAERGWTVMAIDGSENAIRLLKERAAGGALNVETRVSDLTASDFVMPSDAFDLVLVAYYVQRDLFAQAKAAVRPGGVVITIVYIPATGKPWSETRAAPGKLKAFLEGGNYLGV